MKEALKVDIQMTAKQYLKQIRKLDNLIATKLELLEKMRAMSTSVSQTFEPNKIKNKKLRNKTEDLIIKIVDLEREITDDIDRLVDLKRAILQKIDKLENKDHIRILIKRYVLYKTWEQIAVEMNYSFRHVTRIHGHALQEFEKILREEG